MSLVAEAFENMSARPSDHYQPRNTPIPPPTPQADEGGAIGIFQPVIDGLRLPSQVTRLTRERELEEELGLADSRDRRTRIGRQEL